MIENKQSKQGTLYFHTQTRFHRDTTGSVRSPAAYARYDAWLPYLQGDHRLVLLARVSDEVHDEGYLVEGEGVQVMPMPYFEGLKELVFALPVLSIFISNIPDNDGAIYGGRVADPVSSMLARRARRRGLHYVAQVVGDPAEAMQAGSYGRFFRFFHPLMRTWVKRQVRDATAVIYVTKRVLQQRYPARPGAVVAARSDVILKPDNFTKSPRDYETTPIAEPLRIVTVGGHAQRFKGHDVLIRAVAQLKIEGVSTNTVVVGGGRYTQLYTELAREYGVQDVVEFVGHISEPERVREYLRSADLFVLPSLTEGLPRALLEAMAQGIACLATDVGGNSELLDPDALFAPDSSDALANLVLRIVSEDSGGALTELAQSGYETAQWVATHQSGDTLLLDFLEWLSESDPLKIRASRPADVEVVAR